MYNTHEQLALHLPRVLVSLTLIASAIGAIVLNIGFITILTLTLLRGIPISNCGCFGVFLARPPTWVTIIEDLILLALSLGAWQSWKLRASSIKP